MYVGIKVKYSLVTEVKRYVETVNWSPTIGQCVTEFGDLSEI